MQADLPFGVSPMALYPIRRSRVPRRVAVERVERLLPEGDGAVTGA